MNHANHLRQIAIHIEATGIDPADGHRLVELGAVELIDRQFTGRSLHFFANPGREVDPAAQAIHGLSDEFLRDMPTFSEVAGELVSFLAGANVIFHNAPFHATFLNRELIFADIDPLETLCRKLIDTLVLARDCRPDQKNGLDTLRKELDIEIPGDAEGCLAEAHLVANIYLRLSKEDLH